MSRKKALPALLAACVVTAAIVALAVTGPASSGGPSPTRTSWKATAPAMEAGPAALPESPNATIQRTFVSTSGNDANPCTNTAPCRNFAAAIANTTAGGEVVALNSGGYGAFTIPKAITIAGAPGEHVAVTAFAGTAIDVNAGTGDVVVLRNLYLTGLGASTGVWLESDSILHLDSVLVTGFDSDGLAATADGSQVFVRDSMFRRNDNNGLVATGDIRVTVTDSNSEANGVGYLLEGGATAEIFRSTAANNAFNGMVFDASGGTISQSVASGNDGCGVLALSTGTNLTLTGVVLADNSTQGLLTQDGSPVVRIGGSTATRNNVGLMNFDGTLESFGDNLVRGNSSQTSGTITVVGKT
jgi:hypothetical protein